MNSQMQMGMVGIVKKKTFVCTAKILLSDSVVSN